MHDLYILFSTLGGISMFGILGIIIGPIIAALFITIWEIYGDSFKDYLPSVELFSADNTSICDVDDQADSEEEKSDP